MKVYHVPHPGKSAVPVPGPADLQGKRGEVLVAGSSVSDGEAARWAAAIGLFVLAGGRARRTAA